MEIYFRGLVGPDLFGGAGGFTALGVGAETLGLSREHKGPSGT